jgi:hypothetical protein
MFEWIYHPKKITTMAQPNAGSSGMDIVINSCLPREPLRDGLVKGAYKEFIQLSKPTKKIINFVKASILF